MTRLKKWEISKAKFKTDYCNKMRLKHINTLFIIILLAARNTCLGQDSIQLLTLDDCVKIGLEKSSEIIKSKDSLKLSGIALLGAYGQFLPDLNFNAADNYTSGKQLLTTTSPTVVKSKVNEINYQLFSSFNIFNGLADYSSLKISVLNKSAAKYNFERAQQAVAFDITQTYLQVVLDKHIVKFATQNLEASNKREEQLQELTNVGRRAVSDLYQQQAQTSQDKLYLIQSQNKLKNDQVLLLTKLRITDTEKYEFVDIPADTTPLGTDYQNEEQVIAEADKNRADLKSADINVKMALWKIKQYRSGYFPKLNLVGGLYSYGGYFNQLYINGVPQSLNQEAPAQAYFGQVYGSIALDLTWKIFDKLYTKTAVDQARVYSDLAQLNRDDLAISISSDIKMAYNDYISAQQQIETANKGLQAANSSFNVLQGRYDVGNATFIELSNAQNVLFQAQISKEQAAIGLMLQKRIIDYYIGK